MTAGTSDGGLARIDAPEFDLGATLKCGQVFHWRPAGRGFAGAIGDRAVYLEQDNDSLIVTAGCEEIAHRYLALDHPLTEIYTSFPNDPALTSALERCRGLRIIRQPRWECLASFISSALKQVAHIAQISHTLRERFGQPVGRVGEHQIYAYPTAAAVARLEEADLRACGLGFRAPSLLRAAQTLAAERQTTGVDPLEAWAELSRAAAMERLTSLRGVGTKVANCVLLFAYEHLDAFPVDVWIERVLRERYFAARPDASPGELQAFADAYFGRFAGYAQQYLFHHARSSGRDRTLQVVAAAAGRTVSTRRLPRAPKSKRSPANYRKKAIPAAQRIR